MNLEETRKLKHGDMLKCIDNEACNLVLGKIYFFMRLEKDVSGISFIILTKHIDCNGGYNPCRFEKKTDRLLFSDISWEVYEERKRKN